MTEAPEFLLKNPKPVTRLRHYNGRQMIVLEGKVKISDIQGWVENPRIEIAKKKMVAKVGDRELTQDEIFTLMKNDKSMRLSELRDDILKNGLREPLTLSHNGTLLDGNRRFFAIKLLLEGLPQGDPNRQDYEEVTAFVLAKDTSKKDEENVYVEENIAPSLKIEWPDYVKALKVIEAHENEGLEIKDIAKKFSWPASKVRDTIIIQGIINDFLVFATSPIDPNNEDNSGLGLSEQEAETIASDNYQYFNEAKKSFIKALNEDIAFKLRFFRWIYEKKFKSFQEVRIANDAWNDDEARAALMQPDDAAGKAAKAILDYNNRVIKNQGEAVGRIKTFTRFLKEMKANEINSLPQEARDNLAEALEIVIKMSKATSE